MGMSGAGGGVGGRRGEVVGAQGVLSAGWWSAWANVAQKNHRALADRGPYTAHAPPSRADRAYTAATNKHIFSTQYAVV